MKYDRRKFIASMAGVALAATARSHALGAERDNRVIACNQYPWHTFYKRVGKDWASNLDQSLADFKRSGIKGYEPIINNEKSIDELLPLLRKYSLQMHSLYMNSLLHDADGAETSIEQIVAIGKKVSTVSTKIFVINPTPIRWGGDENKSDEELMIQAKNLNTVGKRLKEINIALAYHNHDPEMRVAAREFHHMMIGTDPENVKLCLDSHWIYRGSGNSQVALFDVMKLYGKRIIELHLRQSQGGIWCETFGNGDIDYARLVSELKVLRVTPHVVLEQAVEPGSPGNHDALSAHRESLAFATKLFGIS